jgi:sugar/nucleoside kinase (ribokinase family)
MNFWIEGEGDALKAVLGRIDALFINDEEASLLTGCHSMVEAAASIRALGPSLVIIKRGEHGAMLFDDAGVFCAPAVPLSTVVDPTGAGDTFAGGFMGYLHGSGGVDPIRLRQATVVGTLLASFCVEGFSLDRLVEVTRDRLRNRYDAYAAMTTCPAPSL